MAGRLEFDEDGWNRFEKHVGGSSEFAGDMEDALDGENKENAYRRLRYSAANKCFSAAMVRQVCQTLDIDREELEAIIHGHTPIIDADDSPEVRYLRHVINEHSALQLKAIDESVIKAGASPLQLKEVYVDLNLDLKIVKKYNLKSWLESKKKPETSEESNEPREISGEDLIVKPVPALEAIGHHDRLVLLGPPGSGKSTITAMMALTLAEALRRPEKQRAEVLKPLGKWWPTGALLPVRVILRKIATRFPKELERGRARDLWDHIEAELRASGLDAEAAGVPRRVASAQGAMFLFDGLDEARDEATRARMLESLAEFTRTVGEKCRFLLTARPYAWEAFRDPEVAPADSTPAELAEMHAHYTLDDFDGDQISEFISRWYHAVESAGWPVSDLTKKPAELKDAVKQGDLAALAKNPLLLTLMATLHSNRTRLPDDRADLYNAVVKLLLQRWNEEKDGQQGLLDALGIEGLQMRHIRSVMEGLAYDAHAAHVGRAGVADIPEGKLLDGLKPLLKNDAGKAELALGYMEERAGLLLGQGEKGYRRQYSFPHRTFQEYLAARHLAGRPDFCTRSAELARENPSHWKEVLILAARCTSEDFGLNAANTLVFNLSYPDYAKEHTATDDDWNAALIAARQILEIGTAALDSKPYLSGVLDNVRSWLVPILGVANWPAKMRIEAGDLLARLGDPRPGVGLKDGLPDIDWIEIPPGEFLMGDEPRKERIERAYSIARYPVTVEQYQAFVDDHGYEREEFWPEKKDLAGPANASPEFQFANRPRIGVSWYEAAAFCRWLSAKSGEKIRLPSEKEWERAARHTDGRKFPWGDPDDSLADRCNSKRVVDAISPVGMFPGSHAVCEAADMAGNVWEWCADWYDKDEDSRVLRGGSWINIHPDNFRCANRLNNVPDERFNHIGFRCVCES